MEFIFINKEEKNEVFNYLLFLINMNVFPKMDIRSYDDYIIIEDLIIEYGMQFSIYDNDVMGWTLKRMDKEYPLYLS